jgi:hypothetical protein
VERGVGRICLVALDGELHEHGTDLGQQRARLVHGVDLVIVRRHRQMVVLGSVPERACSAPRRRPLDPPEVTLTRHDRRSAA